jgi:hypothetical protein
MLADANISSQEKKAPSQAARGLSEIYLPERHSQTNFLRDRVPLVPPADQIWREAYLLVSYRETIKTTPDLS